ncbi:MAG: LemA family protein [Minisyncoccia bacterium]
MENTKPFWKSTKGIIIIVVVLVIGYGLLTYNSFITLNENIKGQWAQVETQYQRRLDLIPNLVNSVKGIMTQEQKIFSELANARAQYSGARTVDEKAAAASQVETSLGRLIAVVENYPTLASANTVQTLMSQLEGTENRVSVERSRFNDSVRSFNTKAQRFPSSMIAKIFGFSVHSYFESASGAETAPKVDLQ